jgi:hypothetical protein
MDSELEGTLRAIETRINNTDAKMDKLIERIERLEELPNKYQSEGGCHYHWCFDMPASAVVNQLPDGWQLKVHMAAREHSRICTWASPITHCPWCGEELE